MIAKFGDRLKNLIQYNFLIKMMSLLVAIVLWLVVINEQNPSVESAINVPIAMVNAPPGHKLVYEDTRAKIMVRAPRSYFASYDSDNFKAYVNLSELREGTHQVPVVVSVPQGFELIEVQPEHLQVMLDPYVEVQFTPELIATGTPVAGYTVADIQPASRSVGVVGPKSSVDTVTHVIGYVDVSGKVLPEYTIQVSLFPVDEEGQTVTGARVHPSTIEADVTLARGLYKKILPIHATFMNDLPADYEIANVRINPAQIEVTGDEKLVRALSEIRTEKISFANTALTEDHINRVSRLDLPAGITATNPNVVVEIEVRKKDAAKQNANEPAAEKKEGN